MKRTGRILRRIAFWTIGLLVVVVLLSYFLIQLPFVQNHARQRAVNYLQGQIGTRVDVDRLRIIFPKNVVLEGVYFEDQQGDTLFAGDKLLADISLFKLLRNTLEINNLELLGITANVHRGPDSIYNFDYILEALSGKKPEPVQNASKPIVISLNNIKLERFTLHYIDEPSAMDLRAIFGHFHLRVEEFDLEAQKFAVPEVQLTDARVAFTQAKPLAVPESEAQDLAESKEFIPLDLELGKIEITNVLFAYANAISDVNAEADIGSLSIESDRLDLKKKIIELQDVRLGNSSFAVELGEKQGAVIVKEEAKKEIKVQSQVWSVSVANLKLDNNHLVFDDRSEAPVTEGIDFAHVNIQNLSLDAQDLSYGVNTFAGQFSSGSFREKSGFELNQLSGDFFLGETQGHATDLVLETNQTSVKGDIALRYADFDSLITSPETVYQKTILHDTRISMSDVLFLAPDLGKETFFRNIANETIIVSADVEGRLDDLLIRKLSFSGLRHVELTTSGNIKGLPDVGRAHFDLEIDRFYSRSTDLHALLPAETIPDEILLPEDISARGQFRGDLRSFVANLRLNTSFGDVDIEGTVGLDGSMYFDGELALDQFELGKMLKQDTSVGTVTLSTSADLQDIGTDSLTGSFSGHIDQFEYQGYNYRNVAFEGMATAGSMNGTVSMNDPNLTFDLKAIAELDAVASPALDFTLDLAHADLKALKFMDQSLRLSGLATGNFSSTDPDSLNGTLALKNFTIADSARSVVLDTVFIATAATPDGNTLLLSADFINLEIAGQYQLTTLPARVMDSFNKYFKISDDLIADDTVAQSFDFSALITYSPLFTQLDSNIENFSPVNFEGSYGSAGHEINLHGGSEFIRYGAAAIQNPALEVKTSGNALKYSTGWDIVRMNDLTFRKTSVEGSISNNEIRSELSVLDDLDRRRFLLNTSLRQEGSQLVLYISPEDLLLNYEKWSVSDDNSILFADGTLAVQNFVLSRNGQTLSIRSEPYGFNNPIALEFRDFRIETITEIISGDSLLAGGLIDGTALLHDYFNAPVFTANLGIKDFSYLGDTVGDIAMMIDNETANTLTAKIGITGQGNQVDIEGRYFIDDQKIDLAMDIGRLGLASVQGFSAGSFTDAGGSIRGDLEISGTILKPVVAGDLHFDSAEVKITQFNETYTLANEGVSFRNSDVHFNDFTITDAENNTLEINGIIYTRAFTNFEFALDIVSDNFKVLNTGPQDNELYYGTLYLDSRISIRGGLNEPEINANLTILDNTRMTLVIPQTAPGIVEREGVVRFVDLDNPDLDSVLTAGLDTLNRSSLRGLVAFANIKVKETSEFKLIIDQGTGDFLQLRGDAELSASLDPSGKISLTGTYLLQQGIYELSFNFLKRRFDIRKGSTIIWNGEPTSGAMDVKAVYVVEAAPIDLVGRQLANTTQTELNLYKEKLPFELLLKLTGTLSKPEVAFEIDLPEGNYPVSPDVITTVRARLNQLNREESEVNKQAFALVLLNRFISDDPFRSMAGGTNAESYARQSVSKLLSQQLNNLTADLISGVDLTFDLEATEDYSTGQLQNRTELNVSASKRLLDDRISVTVGSNFGLEGVEQANEKTNNIAGNISAEYQLSRDGRYLLKAYRKNEYEVAVEGHVIETGVSFVIQLDYDKFWEIFKRK